MELMLREEEAGRRWPGVRTPLRGDTLSGSLHSYSSTEMAEFKGTQEAPQDCHPSEHRGQESID